MAPADDMCNFVLDKFARDGRLCNRPSAQTPRLVPTNRTLFPLKRRVAVEVGKGKHFSSEEKYHFMIGTENIRK
jgi:hypothetical protein